MADKKRISETAALRLAEEIVARSMPSGWSAKVVQAPDLLTGSDRMPAEGEELIAWMKDNERDWLH